MKTAVTTDITFETFGCAAAVQPPAVYLTEMVKGKTVDEAYAVTEEAAADELGGLPEKKMHCSMVGVDALRKAITNYRNGVLATTRKTNIRHYFLLAGSLAAEKVLFT